MSFKNPRAWKNFYAYTKHVKDFMARAGLWPLSGHGFVAVSGGLDSMALLFFLKEFRARGLLTALTAIHINHGTRKECDDDEALVALFCQKLEVPLKKVALNLDLSQPNFELAARIARYKVFRQYASEGPEAENSVVYTAHHIDDSFEWHQLQQFKSSNARIVSGIPVKRGVFRRPFLCLTREQIETFVAKLQIPFVRDGSNENLRFERNFIRNNIIPLIKERFPQYLKHYVQRANSEAMAKNKSVFKSLVPPTKLLWDSMGGIVLINENFQNDFAMASEKVFAAIKALSRGQRGTLETQIEKMISAQARGKSGPISFSGGVYGLMGQGVMYFNTEDYLRKYALLDERLLVALKKVVFEGHEMGHAIAGASCTFVPLKSEKYYPWQDQVFPFLCFMHSGAEKNLKAPMAFRRPEKGRFLKAPHFLLPQATSFALNHGMRVTTVGKNFHWRKKRRDYTTGGEIFWCPLFK